MAWMGWPNTEVNSLFQKFAAWTVTKTAIIKLKWFLIFVSISAMIIPNPTNAEMSSMQFMTSRTKRLYNFRLIAFEEATPSPTKVHSFCRWYWYAPYMYMYTCILWHVHFSASQKGNVSHIWLPSATTSRVGERVKTSAVVRVDEMAITASTSSEIE